MTTRHATIGAFLATALLIAVGVNAASPRKLTSDVATPGDLTAELHTLLTSVEQSLESTDSYNSRHEVLKRQALQIAIFAQALAEHEMDSPLRKFAPAMRNAALMLSRAGAFDEATLAFVRLKDARDGRITGTPAVDADWGKLARASTLMHLMKERAEATRRGLRRPKDPDVESRNAMAIALMILVVHGDTQAVKNPADRPVWQEICLEVQSHMSSAAKAIKTRNEAAADHFRMGMEACDKCHQKFKP
ncbi:MAG: hypothetical protein JSS49_25815 [Planctomycetes bacterium]|nr:hypothetical protein [Planctomycetota bacterium]